MTQICALLQPVRNKFNLACYFTEEVPNLLNDPHLAEDCTVIEKIKRYIDKTAPVIEDASFLVDNCPSL